MNRSFAGEENSLFFTYQLPSGKRGFGISAVRYTVEYNLQADGFPEQFLSETFDAIEESFRFPPNDRIDYLKDLAKRK
jgi:hypothetical protein